MLIARLSTVMASLCACALGACGEVTAPQRSEPQPAKNSRYLTEVEFGEDWPLTVATGTVRCLTDIGGGAVVFDAAGRRYAVNGTAKSAAKKQGFADIRPIWAEDTSLAQRFAEETGVTVEEAQSQLGPPLKKNIGPILDAGLAQCRG